MVRTMRGWYARDMSHHTHIIAFVGMAGSGKSTAVEYLTAKGYPKVYFGGVVLQALEDAGLERTAENETIIREKLRREEGNDFVAQRIITQINHLIDAGQHRIIADGIYSWTEFKAMKHAFPGEVSVVAILAPRMLRHRRLASRPERPFTPEEAKHRDWDEIEHLEKGGPIAMADYFVINDESIDEFHADLEQTLKVTGFYDAPGR